MIEPQERNYSNMLVSREQVSMPLTHIVAVVIRPNRPFRARRIRFTDSPTRIVKNVGGECYTVVQGRVMGRVRLHNFYRPEEKKKCAKLKRTRLEYNKEGEQVRVLHNFQVVKVS